MYLFIYLIIWTGIDILYKSVLQKIGEVIC